MQCSHFTAEKTGAAEMTPHRVSDLEELDSGLPTLDSLHSAQPKCVQTLACTHTPVHKRTHTACSVAVPSPNTGVLCGWGSRSLPVLICPVGCYYTFQIRARLRGKEGCRPGREAESPPDSPLRVNIVYVSSSLSPCAHACIRVPTVSPWECLCRGQRPAGTRSVSGAQQRTFRPSVDVPTGCVTTAFI